MSAVGECQHSYAAKESAMEVIKCVACLVDEIDRYRRDYARLAAKMISEGAELTRLRAVAEAAEPLLDVHIDALAYHSARIRLRYCLDAWKEGR